MLIQSVVYTSASKVDTTADKAKSIPFFEFLSQIGLRIDIISEAIEQKWFAGQ